MTDLPGGVIPPMATPVFDRDGAVDHETLDAFTRRLVDAGVHGLFPCGTNGEFTSLAPDQREAIVETVVAAADGPPVLAGVGGTSVSAVIERITAAADAGADAAVVITPYYLPGSQSGYVEYFTRIADEAELPIVLYDLPALVGDALAIETVSGLADHDTVIGLKDSSGDLSRFYKLLTRTPDEFRILQGSTVYGVPSLDFGADGIVAGEANIDPATLARVYDLYDDGEREQAVALVRERVLPIHDAITDVPTIPAIKHLAGRTAGLDLGPPLAPLPELVGAERDRLAEVL